MAYYGNHYNIQYIFFQFNFNTIYIDFVHINKTLTITVWLNNAALEKGINSFQFFQDALKEKLNLQ